MGFFSWRCSKSNISIPTMYLNMPRKYSEVVLVTPDNRCLRGVYDGYGRIISDSGDEINILSEVEEINQVKLVRADKFNGEKYSELEPSKDCPYQGFFYSKSYVTRNFSN